MAFYTPLDDGSFEIERDDGSRLRTALDADALLSMGLEPKPTNIQEFDAANTVAKAGDSATGSMWGRAVTMAPQSEEQIALDSLGQPGTRTVSSEPKKTIPVTPTQPQAAQAPQRSNPTLDLVEGVAAQNLVSRSAPRKAGGKIPVSETVQRAPVASAEDLDALHQQELTTDADVLMRAEDQFRTRNDALDAQIVRNAESEAQLEEQRLKREAVNNKLMQLQEFAQNKEREAAEIQTITPTDDYFRSHGGPWARLLAGAMVFLGGIGQAFSAAGGQQTPNQGLVVLQNAIKEQAELLKQQHEQRAAAGRDARNAYSEMLAAYGTPEMAMQALMDRGEAIADKKVAIMAAKSGNQDLLNQVYQWQQQRSEARAARVAQRNADAAGSQTTSYQFDRGSGGGSAINYKALGLLMDVAKARGESGKGTFTVRLPDGTTGQLQNENLGKEVQAKIVAANAVAEATRRIAHLKNQPGAKTDPAKRAQLQTAAMQLQLALKKKETLGTLDKGSVEFLDKLTGDPVGIIDLGGSDAKLKEIGQSALQEIEDAKRFDLGISSPPATASDE